MPEIDLNCDCGEGTGHDAELLPLVTSANIACGAHAGDAASMAATCALAQRHGVAIGAHPGYADRANFGRLPVALDPSSLRRLVLGQLEALADCAPLRHVKPHGALYNLSAADPAVARTLAETVAEFDRSLLLFGLAGSVSLHAAEAVGLAVAHEVFADRTYQPDGTLTPRSSPHALLEDEESAVDQVLQLVHESRVRAVDGTEVRLRADTVCIHGDGPHAVAFARRVREALAASSAVIRALRP
ncbi:MAG: LamB/YcsF family protein [Verrucomicrobia bacterium]|nr:LamB/YcsF family protein [Verrucomicrobiota bacterium]